MKMRRATLAAVAYQRGYSGDSVAACIATDYGDGWVEIDTEHPAYPRATPGPVGTAAAGLPAPDRSYRCGTELKALLKDWLGIESSATCSCSSMARRMDSLGPDWCESDQGMTQILDVMRAEHAKRWSAGKTILPWTDAGARQLVLLACRRSRARAADAAQNTG